jgi:hypothetical protein
MDIFLSVNNRADVLQIPVMPAEFTISKPQNNDTFETALQGELKLYGSPKLKSIAWSSFFPVRDYPFLRDRSMKGFEYVNKIDSWIAQKLPIRLIISDTPINIAVLVDDWSYKIGQDSNIFYDVSFVEFPMPQIREG